MNQLNKSKSVRINATPTSVKHVYGNYGPAGHYRGSTFSAPSPAGSLDSDSVSTLPWDVTQIHSPNTLRNTQQNTPGNFDRSVRDPQNPAWRPSPANPSPGRFCLPDFDDNDDEETAATSDQTQDEVPSQPPSTPRMSHAELPQTAGSEQGATSRRGEGPPTIETQESRLSKARSDAQKYKPAKSSRLSLTEKARSRSSSPPGLDDSTWNESQIETGTPDALRPRRGNGQLDESTLLSATPARAPSREDLDDEVVGEDNMTDYQREHQYDEWATKLFESIPAQTYTESGVVSSYVEILLQKTWVERDTRESIEFWNREFEEGLKAARDATAQGRELQWITDPDEIIELELSAH
jgi:hypothetical protein